VLTEAAFLVVRLVAGAVFLVALVGKARDLGAFRSAVRGFRVVPRRWERPVALAVLGAEAVVVLLLVVRSTAAVGLAGAALLLSAFAVGMVRVLARGERVACGCFGRSSAPVSAAGVGRNALLALGCAAGAAAGLASDAVPLDGPVLLVAALFAAALVALLLLSDLLLGGARPPRPRAPVGSPSTGTRKR
jgi:hypothetical protein